MLRLGTRPASTRTSEPVEVIAPSVSPDSTETETGTSCRLSSRRCAETTMSPSPLSLSETGPSCAAAGAGQAAAQRATPIAVGEGKGTPEEGSAGTGGVRKWSNQYTQ